jgi:hypothetical protein
MGRILPDRYLAASSIGIELIGKNISREIRAPMCLSPLFNREKRENTRKEE